MVIIEALVGGLVSEEGGSSGLRPGGLMPEPEAADGSAAPGWRRLVRSAVGRAWGAVRPRRSRLSGYLAVAVVGALIGTSAVWGVAAAGSAPRLSDIGAWLSGSQRSTAVHADGLTGAVDGRVKLPTGRHPVSIAQDGRTVLVLDKATGRVARIDPSQLTAEQSTQYGSGGLQLAAAGSFAYVVDPVRGTVQRMDPVRTTPIGEPVRIGARGLGEAIVDPEGRLWVPVPSKGQVVPVLGSRRGRPQSVARRGSSLRLTLANGQPVATDTTDAVLTVLDTNGRGLRIQLPSAIDAAPPHTVLVPARTEGSVVPVLAAVSGQMTLVDIGTGDRTSTSLGRGKPGQFGAPQVLGARVYVPDRSNGTLKVYDTSQARLVDSVRVTGKPGDLEVFVRNGLLWANDQDNATAAVINAQGTVRHIGKYKKKAPAANKPAAKPPALPPPTHATPPPRRPAPPARLRPTPPGTPQTTVSAEGVRVTFSPSPGALQPTGYTLTGAPRTATTSPRTASAEGPFTFDVHRLGCSHQYSFRVVARYANGTTATSPPTAPVRACTAPSGPRRVRTTAAGGGHGGTVTWSRPTNASGSITYTLTWPGHIHTTTATSWTITALDNSQTYVVTVTAANEAGSGPPATGTLDLTPPPRHLSITGNTDNGIDLGIRSRPTTDAGHRVARVAPGDNPPITVDCQTTGSAETNPSTGGHSAIWDKVTYNGTPGWASDLWVSTSNHTKGTYSPEVWRCT